MAWEDGENSFPQEAFAGDSSNPQAGGVSVRSKCSEMGMLLRMGLTFVVVF